MFSRFGSAVKLTAFFLFLSLCLCLWVQFKMIASLKAENHAQAQTIERQSAVISTLKSQALENQQLTLALSQYEAEARRKADETVNAITEKDKSTEAYRTDAPRAVINFLRQE